MAAAIPAVREHVQYVPSAGLRPFLAVGTGYREAGGAPAVHRGLPSPWINFIVTLDEPLVLAAHPDPAQQPGTFEVLIGGLHTSPALITHDGSQSGIQLAVSPLGARALLGMPASEIASVDVHGADVFGRLADQVHDQVAALGTCPERFAALEGFLVKRLRDADERAGIGPELRYAWRQLLRTGAGRQSRISRPRPSGASAICGTGSGPRPGSGRRRPGGSSASTRSGGVWPGGPPLVSRSPWPTWPRRRATSTRRTWTGTFAGWPDARRPGGWPTSSEFRNVQAGSARWLAGSIA
jgi:hypothetical protein